MSTSRDGNNKALYGKSNMCMSSGENNSARCHLSDLCMIIHGNNQLIRKNL